MRGNCFFLRVPPGCGAVPCDSQLGVTDSNPALVAPPQLDLDRPLGYAWVLGPVTVPVVRLMGQGPFSDAIPLGISRVFHVVLPFRVGCDAPFQRNWRCCCLLRFAIFRRSAVR